MTDAARPLRCPRCRQGGYSQSAAHGDRRPLFRCNMCGHEWTSGHDGKPYALKEREK